MGAACCSDLVLPKDQLVVDGTYVSPPVPALPSTDAAPGTDAAPPAACAAAGAEDQFVSQVGELPKFGNKPAEQNGPDQDTVSVASSAQDEASDMVEGHTKEQKTEAKKVVKDFVKKMVKGEKMNVMTESGSLKACTCFLSRGLDTLKIKVGTQQRNIALMEIEEIQVGTEVTGVSTPVDELCATLMLAGGDCLSFRLPDVNARDTFVMCLLMFCNSQPEQ